MNSKANICGNDHIVKYFNTIKWLVNATCKKEETVAM